MEANVAKLIRAPRVADTNGPRDNIRALNEIAAIAEQCRAAGKTVVQAHGTFDLLHPGHVRHLEAARRLGDLLIVTVTADRFVNKGPGRPVFSAELRAEMLATLQYVDFVAINNTPDAVNAIECIRPTVYIKGQDYLNPQRDIAGKITLERQAVEAVGGRIHFTDEITFSSTELINRHVNVFEPHVREHLDRLRVDGLVGEILDLIDRVSEYHVLVVGDAIIDDYQYVLPMGNTQRDSTMATRYHANELLAGGVFAAANHVASFCKQVDILTCLGDLESHEALVRTSLRPNVGLTALQRAGAPTTLRRRFVDPSDMRKLFEVYFMNDERLAHEVQEQLDQIISASAGNYDLVIVTDFGHGLIGPSSAEKLGSKAKFLAVNTQGNSGSLRSNLLTKYPRADYICIDAAEARLAVSNRLSATADTARAIIDNQPDWSKVIVTQGKRGCISYERGGIAHTIPAFAKNVVDTVGAGDAFLAVTSPLVAAGGPMHAIGFIGNVAGALKVEIVGPIEKPALIKGISSLLK